MTICRPDGTSLTIHVGANASIGVAGVDNAKLSDIKVGMVLRAEGAQRSDGSLDATSICAGQAGPRPDRNGPKSGPGATASPTTGNG